MTLNVLVADDQTLVRAGLRMILEAEPDIEVVGEAADGVKAVKEARRLRPDIVLIDVRNALHGRGRGDRRLRETDTTTIKVLILTTFDLDEYVIKGLRAGASGFLFKGTPPERLVEGIHIVARGVALLAPSVTRRLLDTFAAKLSPPDPRIPAALQSLTDRELEVLRLVAKGLSNAEIAENLYLGETTVKTHVSRLLSKLQVRDRVQAVIFAYEAGLVRPGMG